MAEKQVAQLGNFPRGMLPALSRSEIPPDGLFYAENVNLRTPGRVRLAPQDAILANGVTPDHVQRADDEDFLAWHWLLNTGNWALTDYHTLFPASFAGDIYMVAANYVAQTVKVQATGSGGAWTTLTSVLTTNRARPIYATGKNLLIPLVNGSDITYAACWDPTTDTALGNIEVGNSYIQVDLQWDAASATASKVVAVCPETGEWIKLTCMEGHTSGTIPGEDDYVGYEEGDSQYYAGTMPLVKEENAYDKNVGWRRYWRVDGYAPYSDGEPVGYTSVWEPATAYTGLAVTLKIKQTPGVIDEETPGTLPLELFGTETADDTTASSAIKPDGLIPVRLPNMDNFSGWNSTSVPPETALAFPNCPLLTRAEDFRVAITPITSYRPSESEEASGLSRMEYGRSLLLQESLWGAVESVTYYAVHEFDFGGWSRPVELKTMKVLSGEHIDFGIGLQVFGWLADDQWGEATRRVHFFRVENIEGGGLGAETWLFAVDRKDTQWIKGYDAAEAGSAMMALVGYVPIDSEETYTAYPQGKVNYEGSAGDYQFSTAIANYKASATTRAFNQAAEAGYPFSTVLKAGAGLYTFVDYGQDPAAESSQSVIGARISDLLGASAIDPSELTLIDTALGRAFYTANNDGVVYYSEVDRYGIVDPTNFLTFEDSGKLVAAHSLHHYLLLLFQYKTVVVDVRSGMDAGWSLVAEANGAGCLNRDCVARHEGEIFWMGSGAIWMWNGSGAPRRISEAIEYDAFGTDMNDADPPGDVRYAWLAVDPKSKDLVAHLGRANAADYSGWGQLFFEDGNVNAEKGKCLVYNIPSGAWTTELMRGFVATLDTGYGLLGKPFVLDNYLLIPCAKHGTTVYNAMIVRRSYSEFLGPAGAVAHINTVPIWKRAVLETGFLQLAGVAHEFKLDRLHVVFSGDVSGGLGINATVLDHWKLYAYIIQDWEDTFPAEWGILGDLTADYEWDVADEGEAGDVGYHRSYYRKPLPRRQTRAVALRLESQSDDDVAIVYETLAGKVELAALGLSFRPKARF